MNLVNFLFTFPHPDSVYVYVRVSCHAWQWACSLPTPSPRPPTEPMHYQRYSEAINTGNLERKTNHFTATRVTNPIPYRVVSQTCTMVDRRRTVSAGRASWGLSLLVAAALCLGQAQARAQKVEVSAPQPESQCMHCIDCAILNNMNVV